jgi:hypothetical protein
MNFQVLYRSIFDLVRDFMKDEASNQQDRTLRRYLHPELLIIDSCEAVSNVTNATPISNARCSTPGSRRNTTSSSLR